MDTYRLYGDFGRSLLLRVTWAQPEVRAIYWHESYSMRRICADRDQAGGIWVPTPRSEVRDGPGEARARITGPAAEGKPSWPVAARALNLDHATGVRYVRPVSTVLV